MEKKIGIKKSPLIALSYLRKNLNGFEAKIDLDIHSTVEDYINLVVKGLARDKAFLRGDIEILVDFIFPLPSGDFLKSGLRVNSDGYLVEELYVYDRIDLENYGIVELVETPTMFINALIDFKALGGEGSSEVRRIYDVLEDLGFKVSKDRRYPYIEYPLGKEEYEWYYQW